MRIKPEIAGRYIIHISKSELRLLDTKRIEKFTHLTCRGSKSKNNLRQWNNMEQSVNVDVHKIGIRLRRSKSIIQSSIKSRQSPQKLFTLATALTLKEKKLHFIQISKNSDDAPNNHTFTRTCMWG